MASESARLRLTVETIRAGFRKQFDKARTLGRSQHIPFPVARVTSGVTQRTGLSPASADCVRRRQSARSTEHGSASLAHRSYRSINHCYYTFASCCPVRRPSAHSASRRFLGPLVRLLFKPQGKTFLQIFSSQRKRHVQLPT